MRQRQVLERDGVVERLAVASLALELELDEREQSREALLAARENARLAVGRSLVELQEEGVPLAQLIRDAAPG